MLCPSCGFTSPGALKFCGECGRKLASPAPLGYTPPHLAERMLAEQAALEKRSPSEGERKTVTALFADIKGSMELIEDLDPEEARAVIDPALEIMMASVHRYEGYVAQALGDGIFALFGAPIANEEHAVRALYAALRMQEEIGRYAKTLRAERGLSLEVRVGVNTGEVVLRSIRKDDLRTDYAPIGHSTSLAARLQAIATPGSIVTSQDTRKLAEGRFAFRSLGPARVKGVAKPVELWELAGLGTARTRLELAERRGLARFVGRDRELAELQRAFSLAREGHGQLVALVGDAGIGKSRLLYEFERGVRERCLVLEVFGVSHGKSFPYLPLIELLKSYFRVSPDEGADSCRRTVAAKVRMLDESLEDTIPYLLSLLGLPDPSGTLPQMAAEVRRRRTLESLKRLILRETLAQPLMVVVEDLHWVDAETEAFLSALGESLPTARLLLVVSYRPEYRHDWGSWTHYDQIRLDPLGTENALEMLTGLLGGEPALAPLKRRIVEASEGNPFFIEEIVRELFDRGVLARNGTVRVTRPVGEVEIPATVEGLLAGRIDHLPGPQKELLQTAAVIGREFSWGVIRAVSDRPEDELLGLLAELRKAELVYERPAFPEPAYLFKHGLTRDVAYGSVLVERRRELHEGIARAIEELFAGRTEEHYGELAHHYTQGGSTEKAIEYSKLAGERAVQLSANAEAIVHLTTALRLLETLPDRPGRDEDELAVQVMLGAPLMATKGYAAPEVEAAYARARELCSRVGDDSRLFPVLWGLWAYFVVRGDMRPALELANELLVLGERVGDSALLVEAHYALAQSLLFSGDPAAAANHFDRGIAVYDPNVHRAHAFVYGQEPGVTCRAFSTWALWLLGHPDHALRRGAEAVEMARQIGHPYSLLYALFMSASLHQFRRDSESAARFADAVIADAAERGVPFWCSWASVIRGWATAQQGCAAEGAAQIRQGLDTIRAGGSEMASSMILTLLAEALGKAGQVEEGLGALAEALAAATRNGEHWYEAEVYRTKGELLLASSRPEDHTEAETCFRLAIEIARRQRATSLELRAVTSLTRLLRSRSEVEAARVMLAEAYSSFAEGFETPDLRDAKALIDDLRRMPSTPVVAASASVGDLPRAADGPAAVFRREGDFRTIAYEGRTLRLADTKGLRYLAVLLASPDRDFHPIELALAGDGRDPGAVAHAGGKGVPVDAGLVGSNLSGGEAVLDARAKAEYRGRLADLEAEIEEARSFNDTGRRERLERELETLQGELASALGLGGRDRRSATAAERARVNLTKAIRSSIARVDREHPGLGRHLDATIRTGRLFSYTPDPRAPLSWSV